MASPSVSGTCKGKRHGRALPSVCVVGRFLAGLDKDGDVLYTFIFFIEPGNVICLVFLFFFRYDSEF